ncbi:MAG: type I restriction enzyme HsdR N-terminal domain-containing protein [Sphingobacteriales bacterium]|nr:MAG: type I restriction enzyme HsdR N-terminal domain-containing protein [Sphingobacteriales bacterium]
MIMLDFSNITLRLRKAEEKTQVFDPIRKKWIILTPEEHVRQYLLQYLVVTLNYPAGLISVEKKIMVGSMAKRFDVVVYNRDHQPWLLAECKAPEVPITEAALHQLLQYQRTIQCHYWLLTNGHQTYCADACKPNEVNWLEQLPAYEP